MSAPDLLAPAKAADPLKIRWKARGTDNLDGRAPGLRLTISIYRRSIARCWAVYLSGHLVHEVSTVGEVWSETGRNRCGSAREDAKEWAQAQVARWIDEAAAAEARRVADLAADQARARARNELEARRSAAATSAETLARTLLERPELVQASDALTLARLVIESQEGR